MTVRTHTAVTAIPMANTRREMVGDSRPDEDSNAAEYMGCRMNR